jgi:hypothetical protein
LELCASEREGHAEELWWTPNLAAQWLGGVLMSLLVCMGWGMYSSHTRFEVGDCTNFRFWHDLWCGDKVLKEAFPDLYGIAYA